MDLFRGLWHITVQSTSIPTIISFFSNRLLFVLRVCVTFVLAFPHLISLQHSSSSFILST
jgi:hypothetical protein